MFRSVRPLTAHLVKPFVRYVTSVSRTQSLSYLSALDTSKEIRTVYRNSIVFDCKWKTGGYFRRCLSSSKSLAKEQDEVSITFIDRDGDKTTVVARVGDSLLDVAKDNDIDLEGACEGTLACSTCHLIFEPEQFETMPLDPPSEEELDMLDLAYGLTDTSRLGCQILVTKELDGLTLTVPSGTADARLA